MTKGTKALIAALILLSFLNFRMFGVMQSLQNEIRNNNHHIRQLESRVSFLDSSIREALNSFIEEQSWLGQISLSINAIDMEDETVEANISFNINEVVTGSKIEILIYDDPEKVQIKELVIEDISSLRINEKVVLPLNRDYQIFVQMVGDSVIRQGEVGFLRVKSGLESLFISHGYARNAKFDRDNYYEEILFDIFIHLGWHGSEAFQAYRDALSITHMELQLFAGDVLFDTVSIMNNESWTMRDRDFVSFEMIPEVVPVGQKIKDELMIRGSYQFEERINRDTPVRGELVFKDQFGREYRFYVDGLN